MAEVIRIGAFFDGTGANKWNDELINDGSITNVGKIYNLYNKQHEDKVKGFVEPLYEAGIGTREYTKDKPFSKEQIDEIKEAANNGEYFKKIDYYKSADMAFGLGAKEISDGALEKVVKKIENLKNENSNSEIVVDVFGFSRGAAISRDFINSFNESFKDDLNVKISFVGLYDTVTSVGTKHNVYNGDLNLNLDSQSAEKIVHFTAGNERRYNFPLHSLMDEYKESASNIIEHKVLGTHGNVGGGDPYFYKDTIIKDYGTKEYSKDSSVDKEYIKNTIEQTAAQKGYDIQIRDIESLNTFQYIYTQKVDKTNELSIAHLHAMLNIMSESKIELGNYKELGKDYQVSDTFKEYTNTIVNFENVDRFENDFRQSIGASGGSITLNIDEIKQDGLMSLVNVNREQREIFANEPDKAFYYSLEDFIFESLGENSRFETKEEFMDYAKDSDVKKEFEDFKQKLEKQNSKEQEKDDQTNDNLNRQR